MALNNMSGIGINININVNAPGATQTTSQVTAGLDEVAAAAARAAVGAGKFKQEFQQLAGEFVKMVVGKHLIDVFVGLAKATDDITAGMANIKSVMTESFDPAAAMALKSTLMDVAETTGKSFKDLAIITHELISQGLSVKDVQSLAEPLMKFVTVGDISVDKATDLTVALTNMGIASNQAGQAYDVMLNLANKTTIRAPEFVDVMTKAAPAAKLTQQSFIELASSAAILRKSFGSGKEEATALFQTLSTLEKSKIQDKIKKAFGVEVVADKSTGALKPLLSIIQEVNEATLKGHGSIANIFDIFGSRTGSRVFAGGINTLREGMNINGQNRTGQDLIDNTRSSAVNSAGAVDQAFAVKMESLMAQVEKLKASVLNLVADLGGVFAGGLTQVVEFVQKLVSGFRHIIELSPVLVTILGFIVSALGKIALAGGAFLIVSGGAKIFGAALKGVKDSFLGVAAAEGVASIAAKGFWRSLLGPIGLILTIISFIPDILGLFSSGEKAQDKTMGVAESLKQTAFANQTAAEKLNSAAEALQEASEQYRMLVVEYSKGLVTNFPSFDKGKALPAIAAAEKAAAATGIVTPEAAKVMGDQIRQLFSGKPLAGAEGTKTLNEAARALQTLGGATAAAAAEHKPGAAAAVKVFDDMLKTFETMTKNNMVQLTLDTGTLRRGYNPTTSTPTELPHKQRERILNDWSITPTPMVKSGKPMFDTKFREHLEQSHSANFGQFNTQALDVGEGLSVVDRKVIVDRPVQLTVDGTAVGGTLRMNRSQENVENLQSP